MLINGRCKSPVPSHHSFWHNGSDLSYNISSCCWFEPFISTMMLLVFFFSLAFWKLGPPALWQDSLPCQAAAFCLRYGQMSVPQGHDPPQLGYSRVGCPLAITKGYAPLRWHNPTSSRIYIAADSYDRLRRLRVFFNWGLNLIGAWRSEYLVIQPCCRLSCPARLLFSAWYSEDLAIQPCGRISCPTRLLFSACYTEYLAIHPCGRISCPARLLFSVGFTIGFFGRSVSAKLFSG